MEKVKTIGLVILAIVFIAMLVLVKKCGKQETPEAETDSNSCAYFNGEVTEVTNNSIYLRPISEWDHEEVVKVKIPKTRLYEEDSANINPGDKIRVAYNDNTVDIIEDEASIRIVFLLFRLSDNDSPQ
jgi:hypothetical protein